MDYVIPRKVIMQPIWRIKEKEMWQLKTSYCTYFFHLNLSNFSSFVFTFLSKKNNPCSWNSAKKLLSAEYFQTTVFIFF